MLCPLCTYIPAGRWGRWPLLAARNGAVLAAMHKLSHHAGGRVREGKVRYCRLAFRIAEEAPAKDGF